MMRTVYGLRILALVAALMSGRFALAEEATELASQAQAVFQRHCFECHGQNGADEGGMDYVADLSQLVLRGKVKPGNPAGSRVLIRMRSADDPMPPSDVPAKDRPDANAIALIERWIKAGAPTTVQPAVAQPERKPVTTVDVIAAVHGHLSGMELEDRQYQRYFVLNHLHNQSETVSEAQLRSVRAAVSKALNSLSWRFEIITPQPLDLAQTVLVFDTRDVDWDSDRDTGRPDLWVQLVSRYPYAMKHDRYPENRGAQRMATEIYAWTGVEIPWVRADWFVATATRPPLYHTLLYDAVFKNLADRQQVEVTQPDGSTNREPPMFASDLEGWLRVNVSANLRRKRVARAGFTNSGVSSQPRMVERHPALYGAYWLSYDFKRGNPTLNLLARPLGPPAEFPNFKPYHFQQDGGEIVFNLPNGLQGYLLIDGKGKRINDGPPDVVEDSAKILGNSIIVNGLSCMACHKLGMKREFQDQVRFGVAGLSSDARDRVRRLYLDPPDMKRLLDKDEERFLRSVEEACGPFLRNGLEDQRPTEALDEPVGPVAKRFLGEEIDLAQMAAELGIDPKEFVSAIRFNPALGELGLSAVAAGAKIKRETWEAGKGLTMFQVVARQMRVGTPTSVIAPVR